MKRQFIQIYDFEIPHYTGLVFEIENITEDRYWVKDILDDNGEKLSGGGWLKSVCLILNDKYSLEYCLQMIEQTKAVLIWQKLNDK